MGSLALPIMGFFVVALMISFEDIVRKAQRIQPELQELDGRRCLMITPNLAMLAGEMAGVVFFGAAGVGGLLLVFAGYKNLADMGPSVALQAAFGETCLFGMTAYCLYSSLRLWKSRVFIYQDGVHLRLFLRKAIFLKWGDLDHLRRRPLLGGVEAVSKNSERFRVEYYWNGGAYLFFFLERFLKEDQWGDAKRSIEVTLRKKQKLDTLRRQFDEFLLDHPLDAFQPEVERGAELVPPS